MSDALRFIRGKCYLTDMGDNRLYIHIGSKESAVVQVTNGHLTGVLRSDDIPAGTLYIGRITGINNALSAAFLDIGEDRDGFMHITPGHGFKCGQCMLVQSQKHPRDNKGRQVTNSISLVGNLLCISPGGRTTVVSSKVKDPEDRDRMMAIGEEVRRTLTEDLVMEFGVTMRTISSRCGVEAALAEARTLAETWRVAVDQLARSAVPGPIDVGRNFVSYGLQRFLTEEIREIIIDDHDTFCQVSDAVRLMGFQTISVREYSQPYDMFEYYNLNAMQRHALGHRVYLPSGGSIVIDRTEALTVIDVNSGKGSTAKDMVIQTNLQAAEEIAAQLRLRNIGGIIVIDFINMDREGEAQVLNQLKEATAGDKLVTDICNFSPLGLVEMVRRRVEL